MAGNTQNIRLGPCRVIWGVEDLGFTKGGVEVTFTSTQVNITSDQFGDTPMDKYLTSRTVTAKVPLIETIPGKLDLIVNGGDGTAELAEVQTVAGLSIRDSSQSLTLHPLSKADDDHSEDFVIVRAGVIPNFSATYDTDNERVWNVTFTSFPYYGEFGDIMGADKAGVVVYGDRSSVVAAGGLWRKSNRTTIGTYFDKNGIMQTAPAGVTRPNFVYKNGVWKQEGWLLEGQATNILDGATYPTSDPKFGSINDTPNMGTSFFSHIGNTGVATFSCFLKISATANNFWWGGALGRPIVTITNGEFTGGNPSYYDASLTNIDDNWQYFVMHFNNPSIDGDGAAPYFSGATYACAQMEQGTSATSYIPSDTTRAAD